MSSKTNLAIIWVTIETFGKQIITLLITIILARLLEPSDFGLLGMVMVFILIASVIVDGGFGAALIYKQDVTDKDYSTVFYISLIVSIILYLVVFALSKLVANFYDQPELVSILRWLSISFILGSLSVVPHAMYSKEMNFKIIAKVGLVSQLVSGVIAIIIAKLGGGVWSLVAQTLLVNFFTAVIFWILNKWRPILYFSLKNLIPLVKYGINLMFTAIINSIFDNLYYVIIGKFYSSDQLGYYVQANRIQSIPPSRIQSILQKSSFPEFTRIAHSKLETRNYFNNLFINSLFINFPILFAMAALSNDIVIFLLTDKWEAIIPYLKLLCFGSLFLPVYALTSNILLAQGKSFLNLKIEIVSKALIILTILISIRFGIKGLIIGQIINSVFFLSIYLYIINRIIKINIFQLIMIILQYLIISTIPYLLIGLFLKYYTMGHFLNILILGSLYVLIYFALARVFKLNKHIRINILLNSILKR